MFFAVPLVRSNAQQVDWPIYLGGKERNLYSSIDQINRSNVKRLKVAWTYETGSEAEYQANNLIIGGVLYTPTALAKSWRSMRPPVRRSGNGILPKSTLGQVALVSVASFTGPTETGGERRIFTGVNGFLFAIDPATGKTIREFGENGSINLGSGLNTPGLSIRTC